MSQPTSPRGPQEPSQQPAASERLIKLSLKGIPPVTASQWAQLQAAVRKPSPGRRYPEIADQPEAP